MSDTVSDTWVVATRHVRAATDRSRLALSFPCDCGDASAPAAGGRATRGPPGVLRARHRPRRPRNRARARPRQRQAARVGASPGSALHLAGDASARRRGRARHDNRSPRKALFHACRRGVRVAGGLAAAGRRVAPRQIARDQAEPDGPRLPRHGGVLRAEPHRRLGRGMERGRAVPRGLHAQARDRRDGARRAQSGSRHPARASTHCCAS